MNLTGKWLFQEEFSLGMDRGIANLVHQGDVITGVLEFEEKIEDETPFKVNCQLEGGVVKGVITLNVTCFDMSEQGKLKALKLAELNNVKINYIVGELSEMDFEESSFDVIALIYAHFPPNVKSQYHQKIAKWLKKDGVLILEGFSEKQFEINEEYKQSFGPKKKEMLYTVEGIENDFSSLETIELSEELIDLNEGIHHKG